MSVSDVTELLAECAAAVCRLPSRGRPPALDKLRCRLWAACLGFQWRALQFREPTFLGPPGLCALKTSARSPIRMTSSHLGGGHRSKEPSGGGA